MRAQRLQQARRLLGEQTGDRCDVGVGGADGYAEAGSDPREGVMAKQVHECDQRTAVRREFAPPVTLTGDDEHRDPLDQGVGQVECGRIWNQQGSCAAELRRRTPPSTAREPCPLRIPTSHRPVTPSVATLKQLTGSHVWCRDGYTITSRDGRRFKTTAVQTEILSAHHHGFPVCSTYKITHGTSRPGSDLLWVTGTCVHSASTSALGGPTARPAQPAATLAPEANTQLEPDAAAKTDPPHYVDCRKRLSCPHG